MPFRKFRYVYCSINLCKLHHKCVGMPVYPPLALSIPRPPCETETGGATACQRGEPLLQVVTTEDEEVASLTQAAPGREQPEYWVERGFFSNLDPAYIKVIIDVFAFEVLFYDFV